MGWEVCLTMHNLPLFYFKSHFMAKQQDVKILYQYVAGENPQAAKAVILKYGYKVPQLRNARELGSLLQSLVGVEGEEAFRDIMEIHPDKDLIMEMFTPEEKHNMVGADGKGSSGCGCNSCKGNFSNATGPDPLLLQQNTAQIAAMNNNTAAQHTTSTQTGVIILSCAVIIALAIMSKK